MKTIGIVIDTDKQQRFECTILFIIESDLFHHEFFLVT